MARRRLGGLLQTREGACDPGAEVARLIEARESEGRRAHDAFRQQRRGRASGEADDLGAAAVGGDESGFRGGERHVIVALRVQPVDSERADYPDRDLQRSDQVLDVGAIGREDRLGVGIGDRPLVGFGGRRFLEQRAPGRVQRGEARVARRPDPRLARPLGLRRQPVAQFVRAEARGEFRDIVGDLGARRRQGKHPPKPRR